MNRHYQWRQSRVHYGKKSSYDGYSMYILSCCLNRSTSPMSSTDWRAAVELTRRLIASSWLRCRALSRCICSSVIFCSSWRRAVFCIIFFTCHIEMSYRNWMTFRATNAHESYGHFVSVIVSKSRIDEHDWLNWTLVDGRRYRSSAIADKFCDTPYYLENSLRVKTNNKKLSYATATVPGRAEHHNSPPDWTRQ